MKLYILMVLLVAEQFSSATTFDDIIAGNTRAIVYLEVQGSGGVVDRGSGFIVSHDGYIVTVAHLKVDPTQKLWAVIGQRAGTRYPLEFRDLDETHDIALWQLPQSASCRNAATLSNTPVKVLDRALVMGFPENDGLTPSRVSINNLSSQHGFYKSDGYLRPGNSGGPVFSEGGEVIAVVQGGTLPGTDNNDLIPIAPVISLVRKNGVQAGIGAPAPFANSCYGSCRTPANGVEKWTVEKSWGPVDSGWVSGGHNRRDECNKLIAASVAANPGSQIDLLPGEGVPNTTGMWEESQKDILGHVEYKYFCKGTLRSGPIYFEKQSPECGLLD